MRYSSSTSKLTIRGRRVESGLTFRVGDAETDSGDEDQATDDGEGDLNDAPRTLALDLAGAGVDEKPKHLFAVAVRADSDR
jgi:hypothetical protein